MTPTQREFHGPLASHIKRFAAIMERSGGSHAALFIILQRLDRFLAAKHPETIHLSRPILEEWFASFAPPAATQNPPPVATPNSPT